MISARSMEQHQHGGGSGIRTTVQRSPSVKAYCRGSNIMAETAVRRCMFLLWFLCGQPHKETNQPILGRVLYRSHRPAFETEYWRNRPQGRERHRPFLRACSAEAQDLASSPKSHFRSPQGNYRRSIDLADVSWLLQALAGAQEGSVATLQECFDKLGRYGPRTISRRSVQMAPIRTGSHPSGG